MARETLVATYLQNASDHLLLFGLDGSPQGEIPLPGIGSIVDDRCGAGGRGSPLRVHVVHAAADGGTFCRLRLRGSFRLKAECHG